MSNIVYVEKMVKACSPTNLLRKAAAKGYTSDGQKRVCPACKKRFFKGASPRARNSRDFYKKVVYSAIIFTKAGEHPHAACHCGYRKVPSTKPAPTGQCAAITKNGGRCRNKAKENGLCGIHHNSANTPDPQVGHRTNLF